MVFYSRYVSQLTVETLEERILTLTRPSRKPCPHFYYLCQHSPVFSDLRLLPDDQFQEGKDMGFLDA